MLKINKFYLVLTTGVLGAALATCTQSPAQHGTSALASAGQMVSSIGGAVVTPAFAQAAQSPQTIADIAERVVPSVVNVAAVKVSNSSHHIDPMFRNFFGGGGPRRQTGQGSGVILSADGLIVTNNHVVEGAEKLTVTLTDGREFSAEIVGTDPRSDLAVAKLKNASNLTPIAIGSSEKMRLGEVVLAVGNPFGVGQTVTMGIVSAKGRSRVGIADIEDFIQTDAAINPGNSGGALVNMKGELIGVNTAILSRTGGYQGIGFAIPTDMVSPIVDSLKNGGVVRRGWLGVAIQDLDGELAQAMGMPAGSGVLIADVNDGTPASKAGILRGDVVTHLNGKRVRNQGQLRNRIAAAGEGATVDVKIKRDGSTKNVRVTLGLRPDQPRIAGHTNQSTKGKTKSVLGVGVIDLDERNRSQFSIDASVAGALVVSVSSGSPALEAGIKTGDVIVEAGGVAISSASALERYAKKNIPSKKPILLVINRQGASIYVAVSP